MSEDYLNIDEYLIEDYKDNTLLIRKKYLPLIVYPGKVEGTWYFSIPMSSNPEFNKMYHKWFYTKFREIVYDIVAKRRLTLRENQANPDYKRTGWYLPMAVYLEIWKMWHEENVPLITDILRPPEAIYGRKNHELWREEILDIVEEWFEKKNEVQK